MPEPNVLQQPELLIAKPGEKTAIWRHPTVAYVAPFALFLCLLALKKIVPVPQALRLCAVTGVILLFSRRLLSIRFRQPVGSALLGIGVFAIWIGPDLLFPGYRAHWLFSNSMFGSAVSSLAAADRTSVPFLVLRVLESALIVPILEELFWRGWLMRWLIDRDFERVPLGAYSAQAFWIVAALFASEHGPYWEVGLIAGVAYNWWMVRTRSLMDCILAHGVTNALLAGYVIATGQWQFWL